MLHDRDATTLARVRRRQRPMMIAGALLFLLGAVYSLWAVDRLHGTPAAEETNAFDRPIAAFAQSISAQRDRLDRLQPVTSTERSLLAELRAQADTTGRLLLFVLRFLVGSVVLAVGLMLLAATLAQRPLLSIFGRLRIAESSPLVLTDQHPRHPRRVTNLLPLYHYVSPVPHRAPFSEVACGSCGLALDGPSVW